VIVKDSYRTVFHPLEKFWDKSLSGDAWGAYGLWGQTQMEDILKRIGADKHDDRKDKIRFAPGPTDRYWKVAKAREVRLSDGRIKYEPSLLGGYYLVSAPECYPTTTCVSFLEATKAKGPDGHKKPLIELLLNREEIDWKSVPDSPFGSWVPSKFAKAAEQKTFFDGKVMLQEGKNERDWSRQASDVINNLGYKRILPIKGTYRSYLTLHNLKVWQAYASSGGVGNPNSRRVTHPYGTIDSKSAMASNLRQPYNHYLQRGTLGVGDESLDIEEPFF
jgi:hypothetical protein